MDWYFSFPTHPFGTHVHPQPSLLKCNPFFPESSEWLIRTGCQHQQQAWWNSPSQVCHQVHASVLS